MAWSKRQRFGFGRVSFARFRRSVRGRAAWLAEDLGGGRDDLPPLYPLPGRPGDDLDEFERLPVPGQRRRSSRPAPLPAGIDEPGADGELIDSGVGPGSASIRPGFGSDGPGREGGRSRATPAGVPDRSGDGERLVRAAGPSGPQDGPTMAADGSGDGPGDVPDVVSGPGRSRSVVARGWGSNGPRPDDDEDEDGPPSDVEAWHGYDEDGHARRGPGLWADEDRRPVAPGWLRHPALSGRRWLLHAVHTVLFQLLATPGYVRRAVWYAPRGLRITVGRLVRWAFDREAHELRLSAIARDDAREYLHLSRQRNQRVSNRVPVAVALVVVVVVVVAVGWWYSLVSRIATVVLVVGLLGWRGTPVDATFIEHATVPPRVRRITGELLIQAFAAAKLCSLDPERAPGPIRFVTQVAVDGPGTKAIVELPAGVTASKALASREQIAAGLDVDEFRVFLQRQRGTSGSARRVEVWVADKDPYEDPSPVSPLVKAKTWDFWRGFPFGVDARGRQVVVPLVWSSLLVGSIPRMGKTNAARIAAAAAALDAHVRLLVFDGKGGKDWKPFETCAHFYASGVRTLVVEALLAILREAVEDMNRRYEAMQDLPDDVCPEGKVTPYITRRRGYQMPLTLICVDEVHRYLEHPAHGKAICALLTELAKAGPASGYMLVLATQRPDTKTVPEDLRGQMGTRFALRTMNWQASETILGAGTYTSGLDSSKFLPIHKGVGILRGAGDDTELGDAEAITVRSHRLDLRSVRAIAARGRQLRITSGTLTGTAAGDEVVADGPKRRLLDDILDVFEPAEDRMWSETVCLRLAARWPDIYDGWDATTLANLLRPFGIETTQQWGRTAEGGGANRRGITRQVLLDAIAAREERTIDARSVDDSGPRAGTERPERPGPARRAGPRALAGQPARSSTPDTDPDQGPSD